MCFCGLASASGRGAWEFLAIDFKAGPIPKYREDWRLEDPVEAVLSTCSTLLALVNVEGSRMIQFSHFSVKEILTSSRFGEKGDTISQRYHISPIPAHTLVAQAYLSILLHLDKSITRDGLANFPLAQYAAENWFGHARFEGVSRDVDEGMKQLFDRRKPHLSVWLWIWKPGSTEGPVPPQGTALHYAAFCGVNEIVMSWPLRIQRTWILGASMTSLGLCTLLQERDMWKSYGHLLSTAQT